MPKLYVVATPIGNLNDLTPRMRSAVEAADLIASEDTRVTMKLLTHWDIKKPMISCHRHNEDKRAGEIVERMLAEDLTVALTCDAGTPAVSDPGHILVHEAALAGIEIEPVSGPSAVVTALSASGFDSREFAFFGFLPREKHELNEKLDSIRKTGIPVCILYESPHRVVDLIEQIGAAWPSCQLCVCSDLTKKFERFYRGDPEHVLAEMKANAGIEKGEYCIVCDLSPLPPAEEKLPVPGAMVWMLSQILEHDASIAEAAQSAAEIGCSRNDIYAAKLRIMDMFEDDDDE